MAGCDWWQGARWALARGFRVRVAEAVEEFEDVLTEADVGAGCERMECSTVDGDRRLEARQL